MIYPITYIHIKGNPRKNTIDELPAPEVQTFAVSTPLRRASGASEAPWPAASEWGPGELM